MSDTNIGLQRLANQHISGTKFETPGGVVRWMGAMQAQDYLQAVWAVGLRTQSGLLTEVEQAIKDAQIIRTWPMRGTIHFIAPEDAKWRLNLSASRMIAADQRRLSQLNLDVKLMKRCQDIFREVLSGGKRLTRSALLNGLGERGIEAEKGRGYHILWYAAQEGVICMGPNEGKEQTFVLLDEWVPNLREITREEALAELALRYFCSHAPATVHDLAWWAGITVTDARSGVASIKEQLICEKINGKEYWMSADSPTPAAEDEPSIYLLPGFDEYLLGYKDRSDVLAAEHAQKIVPGNNGVFRPMIVVNGQVVGRWQRSITKKAVKVSFDPFTELSDFDTRLLQQANAYATFVGLSLKGE